MAVETENERNEAIESVSVIDGLITSRIVYENNTVNDQNEFIGN